MFGPLPLWIGTTARFVVNKRRCPFLAVGVAEAEDRAKLQRREEQRSPDWRLDGAADPAGLRHLRHDNCCLVEAPLSPGAQ